MPSFAPGRPHDAERRPRRRPCRRRRAAALTALSPCPCHPWAAATVPLNAIPNNSFSLVAAGGSGCAISLLAPSRSNLLKMHLSSVLRKVTVGYSCKRVANGYSCRPVSNRYASHAAEPQYIHAACTLNLRVSHAHLNVHNYNLQIGTQLHSPRTFYDIQLIPQTPRLARWPSCLRLLVCLA